MDYKDLNELNEEYNQGKFEYPKTMRVGGIEYHYNQSSNYGLAESITGKIGMVVYSAEYQEDLVFLNGMKPLGVLPMNELNEAEGAKAPNLGGIKADIMRTVKDHLTKHGDKHDKSREKTLKDVEKMVTKHSDKMDKMNRDHEKRMGDLTKAYDDLLQTHNDAIDNLKGEHESHLGDLQGAHEELKKAHDESRDQMKRDHDEHKGGLQKNHEEHIRKLMDLHNEKLRNMKRDNEDKMHSVKKAHEEAFRKSNQSHEDKFKNAVASHEENQEQMTMKHQEHMDGVQSKHDESKIGTEAHVEVLNLHNAPALNAKVDTGATICSLHADQLQVDRTKQMVKFTNKELSPHVMSVPVATMSGVKSADGGMSYRPVILLNLRIKGKEIPNVEVNLNDREHMSHPFLIGHNALEKGKFIIDPSYVGEGEVIDFNALQSLFANA